MTGAAALHHRFAAVRDRTEALAAPLGPEDQVVQSMPDCSPTKWHRAHTTWFFEEFVLGAHAGVDAVDPNYRYLFNSYYEAVGPRQPRPHRGLITRPTVDEVAAYRAEVDRRVHDALDAGLPEEALALIELGCHHEEQHQELLLMDAKHLLFQNPLRPAYLPEPDTGAPTGPVPGPGSWDWVRHPGGIVPVGHDGRGFAFDNEGPRHEELVPPFALADRLVTCGEWQAFIDDGGYRRPELWLSDGWSAVQAEGWDAPLYWEHDADGWRVFTLRGSQPVDDAQPVAHVSLYEADAYARWAGHRLPTEVEWEAVAHPLGSEALGGPADASVDPGSLQPRPAGRHRPGGPPRQLFDEVWEWTASAYLPYPGFQPAGGAVGEYNGKFMSGQHVLRGGSCATPSGHTRTTYRNFFPPGARWAFSGVRVATDLEPPAGRRSSRHLRPEPVTVDVLLDPVDWSTHLAEETRRGLSAPSPWIPPVWFYDDRGSELFDEITRLPEYYPTHAERSILAERAADIAAATGADTLVELGSGTSEKTRLLLDAIARGPAGLRRFVPFDVSEAVLRAAAVDVAATWPGVEVHAVVGDFHRHLGRLPLGGRRLVAFLGGTVGNFEPERRGPFLAAVAAQLQPGDSFLLGTDLVKDVDRLLAAYDDSAGITAAFDRNALAVLNRELGADFDLSAFRHRSHWDAERRWIEMHLVAESDQLVTVAGLDDLQVRFPAGGHLRTEISAKFTPEGVAAELAAAGLRVTARWTDEAGDFLLTLAEPSP